MKICFLNCKYLHNGWTSAKVGWSLAYKFLSSENEVGDLLFFSYCNKVYSMKYLYTQYEKKFNAKSA